MSDVYFTSERNGIQINRPTNKDTFKILGIVQIIFY